MTGRERTPMTTNEALAKVTAEVDAIFAKSLEDLEGSLTDRGFNDDEIVTVLEIAERTRVQERARVLAELRAWLQRDGETLQ